MYVDKVTFLGITAALAAGGVGGYLYHAASSAHQGHEPTVATPENADKAAPEHAVQPTDDKHVVLSDPLPAAKTCDDTVGAPAECPVTVSSEDEGICGGGIAWGPKRCVDFKASFKPKVAEAAVACIKGLKGNETCDEKRVALCGHEALMMACQEDTPATHADVTSVNVGTAPALAAGASSLASQCESMVKDASTASPGVSYADCMRTLSGMTDAGRSSTLSCMKTHAADKGLVGCEAATVVKTAALE